MDGTFPPMTGQVPVDVSVAVDVDVATTPAIGQPEESRADDERPVVDGATRR